MAAQAPPSTLALAIGFTIVGGITGFFLGQANSIGVFSSSKTRSRKGKRKPAVGGDVDLTDKPVKSAEAKTSEIDADGARDESDGSGESGSGSEVEEGSDEDFDGELKAFEDVKGECKMTLVVRTDLQMGKGALLHSICSLSTLASSVTKRLFASPSHRTRPDLLTVCRQDRRSMLPRHPCQLHDPPSAASHLVSSPTLANAWSSKGRAEGGLGG